MQWVAEIYLLVILKVESDPALIGFVLTLIVFSLTGAFLGYWLALYVGTARILKRGDEEK